MKPVRNKTLVRITRIFIPYLVICFILQLETTIYTTCGKCRRPLTMPAGSKKMADLNRGRFSYCSTCQVPCVTCSIWCITFELSLLTVLIMNPTIAAFLSGLCSFNVRSVTMEVIRLVIGITTHSIQWLTYQPRFIENVRQAMILAYLIRQGNHPRVRLAWPMMTLLQLSVVQVLLLKHPPWRVQGKFRYEPNCEVIFALLDADTSVGQRVLTSMICECQRLC